MAVDTAPMTGEGVAAGSEVGVGTKVTADVGVEVGRTGGVVGVGIKGTGVGVGGTGVGVGGTGVGVAGIVGSTTMRVVVVALGVALIEEGWASADT